MKNILDLAFEILPNIRCAKCRNASVWIQLPVTNRVTERRIENFISLAKELTDEQVFETRIRFVRKSDNVLFAIIQAKLW
jgi:hypothetical protein